MKTVINAVMVFSLCLLLAGTTAAIDKTDKSKKKKPSKTVVIDKNQQGGQTDSQKGLTDQTGSRAKKKSFDDFIDANNNGIDDRAEKKAISGKVKKEGTGSKKADPEKKKK